MPVVPPPRRLPSGSSTPRPIDDLLPPPPKAQTVAEHARFVLAAEFDIDSGATIRHQFPYPVTPAGSHFLAELMLPDGAHLHRTDTTVFYLNQVAGNMVSDGLLSEDDRSSEDDDELAPARRSDQSQLPNSGKEVLYVLNCVSLKENQAVRRGAEVKALAVCFPHPFIQAYKPLLILALERYFAAPSVAVLSHLFDAINSIDTAGMPRFSRWEKWILRATDRRDLFAESFRDPKRSTLGDGGGDDDGPTDSPVLEMDLGNVITPGSLSNSSSFSSLSLPGSPPPPTPPPKGFPPSLDLFQNEQQQSLVRSTSSNRPSHGLPSSSGSFSVGDVGRRQRDTHVFETSATLEGTTLPMSIPLTAFHEEVGEYSLKELIRKFSPSPAPLFPGPFIASLHTSGASTPPVILLLNALLTSRRVLFLGHNKPAGDVAAYVLAACALASGSGAVLRGFAARAFPYTNLMGLDVLEQVEELGTGGWVAGVTNPRFEDLSSRWDVLCNIDSGRIIVSKECRGERDTRGVDEGKASDVSLARSHGTDELGEFGGLDVSAGSGTARGKNSRSDSVGTTGKSGAGAGLGGDQDSLFMEEINSLIDRHYGECIIRSRVAEYLLHFVRLAARYEDETYASLTQGRVWYPTATADPSRGKLGAGAVLWEFEVAGGDVGPSLGSVNSAAATTMTAAGEKKRRESDVAGGGGQGSDGRKTVAEWIGPAGIKRIETWRRSQSYELWKEDFAEHQRTTKLSFDLPHQLALLRSTRPIPEREAVAIFQTFATEVRTYDQVVEVLAHTPHNRGGLTPFGFGLFHPNHEIKAATVEFFDTLQQYPIGLAFLLSLNGFHRLAYKRLSDERSQAVIAQIDQARQAAGFDSPLGPAAGLHAESADLAAVGLGMNGAGI